MPKILEPILTPQDAPWGRQVNERLAKLRSDVDRSAGGRVATDKGVAGSVNSLSEQVRDLSGRVSYSLEGNSFQSWTSTQADDFPFGDILTFTLTETRMVSLQFLVDVGAAATISNTTSSAGARIYASLIVNSAPRYPRTSNMVSASVAGATGRAANQGATTSATANARLLIELPAGTHTVQGCLRQRRVDISGSGAGNINADGYQLFVDVLQTTGA